MLAEIITILMTPASILAAIALIALGVYYLILKTRRGLRNKSIKENRKWRKSWFNKQLQSPTMINDLPDLGTKYHRRIDLDSALDQQQELEQDIEDLDFIENIE
ncbi:hypothetical protein ACFLU6_14740 [Acidobacteriota bacterium]